jgi:hypothetical protein
MVRPTPDYLVGKSTTPLDIDSFTMKGIALAGAGSGYGRTRRACILILRAIVATVQLCARYADRDGVVETARGATLPNSRRMRVQPRRPRQALRR